MKRVAAVLFCAVFPFWVCSSAARAEEPPSGAAKVETEGGKKPAVLFEHLQHGDVKCEICHHPEHNEAGERLCGKCHKLEDDTGSKASKIETAMHGKDTGKCFACHRAEDAANKLKCGDCHKD